MRLRNLHLCRTFKGLDHPGQVNKLRPPWLPRSGIWCNAKSLGTFRVRLRRSRAGTIACKNHIASKTLLCQQPSNDGTDLKCTQVARNCRHHRCLGDPDLPHLVLCSLSLRWSVLLLRLPQLLRELSTAETGAEIQRWSGPFHAVSRVPARTLQPNARAARIRTL